MVYYFKYYIMVVRGDLLLITLLVWGKGGDDSSA